jgi:hypothetical protein
VAAARQQQPTLDLHVNEGKAKISLAAVAHGRVRSEQGYTATMLVEEVADPSGLLFQNPADESEWSGFVPRAHRRNDDRRRSGLSTQTDDGQLLSESC